MNRHIVFDCDGTLIDTSSLKYTVFQGIKELLSELAPTCRFYVWTGRDRLSTHRILKNQDILHHFEALSTADDAGPKPSITGLLNLVGDHSKTSVCVIGDSSFDILGAKSFGVRSIGAAWSKNAQESSLREAGADFIATHPSDCSKLIQLILK